MGTPLRVLSIDELGMARCVDSVDRDYFCPVQTVLLDQPPRPGEWILVHIDTAMRALETSEARHIADAIAAVEAASRGESFDHLIADLVDSEPQLPDHLRDQHASNAHLLVTEIQK